jgi:hypothetical protein
MNHLFPEVHRDDGGTKPSILWSAILRDDTLLVEADLGAAALYEVQEAAQLLLKKAPTPGWEHSTLNRTRIGVTGGNRSSIASTSSGTEKLKGMKFHVFEHCGLNTDMHDDEEELQRQNFIRNHQQHQRHSPQMNGTNGLTIWTFACVYDPAIVDTIQVQSFLEKIVTITEIYRQPTVAATDQNSNRFVESPLKDENYNPFSASYGQSTNQTTTNAEELWRYGSKHALQDSFSSTLRQRMEEVSYLGKMAMCHNQLDAIKEIMARNIELILDNEDRLASMTNKAEELNDMAKVFAKRSKQVKRQMLWNNAKHGAMLGAAITAGLAIVVVPPLIAIL